MHKLKHIPKIDSIKILFIGFMLNTKKNVTGYFIELLLIIVGITLSIYLNNWVTKKSEDKLAKTLLVDLKNDFVTDSLNMYAHITTNQKFIDAYNQLIHADSYDQIKDSMSIILDFMISYSKHKSQNTAYIGIIQNGHTRLFQDKKLVKRIIEYYTVQNDVIKSWNRIDEDFVINRLIPKYETHIPQYMDVIFGQRDAKQAYFAIKNDPHFLNLIQTNILCKISVKAVLMQNLSAAREIIRHIEN